MQIVLKKYEYYQPELYYNGQRLQYVTSTFMYTFRDKVDASFKQLGGSALESEDFEKTNVKS